VNDTAKPTQTIAAKALLLALLVLATYAGTLGHEFSYDDRGIILRDGYLGELSWFELATRSYWGERGDGLYRPLTTLSYALNYAVGGESPSIYHGFNIALHALNVLLLLLLCQQYWSVERAFFTALIFAVNPVLSEVVSSVVGRAELLSFTFGVLGLLVNCRCKKESERIKKISLHLLCALLLCCSQLAKENGMAFSLALVCVGLSQRRRVWSAWVFPALAIVVATAIKWFAIGELKPTVIGFIDNPLAYVTTAIRWANGLTLLVRYVFKLAFPWPLSADYSYDQIPLYTSWLSLDIVLAFVLSCSLMLSAFYLLKQRKRAWIWAALTGLPILMVCSMPIASSTIFAERLLYLPAVGLSLILAGCLTGLKARKKHRLLLCLALLYATLAWQRSWVWESDTTLFASLVQTSPRSARSHYGQALSMHGQEKYVQALAAYDRALVIYPQYVDALFNRGALLLSMGRVDAAYESYQLATEKNPDYVKARRALAILEIERGEVDRGIERLKTLVAERGEYIEASESLILALWNIGRHEDAKGVLDEAIRLHPSADKLHRLWDEIRQGDSK